MVAPNPPRAKTIDEERLRTLLHDCRGDVAFLEELLVDFESDAFLYLRDIQESEDRAEIRRAVHTILGSARTLGMSQLAKTCAALEEQLRQTPLRSAQFEELARQTRLSICALAATLAQIAAA